MKNSTKLVMLGLLLIPFAGLNVGDAFAETIIVDQASGASTPTNEKFFDPPEVTIAVGDTVKWTNSDSATHTVSSGDPDNPGDWGKAFDSGLRKPGDAFEFKFDKAGEYPYLCQLHPWMIGKVIVGGTPPPEDGGDKMPTIVIPTDNDSVDVEVTVDKGMVEGSDFMIDPPQGVTFDIRFLDPESGEPIEHLNYQFHVVDEGGNMVAHEMTNHVMGGTDSKTVTFSTTGSYTLMIVVEGTGTSPPFNTEYSGTATSSIAVTPEFPLAAILPLVLSFVAIVAIMRFRSTKNIPGL